MSFQLGLLAIVFTESTRLCLQCWRSKLTFHMSAKDSNLGFLDCTASGLPHPLMVRTSQAHQWFTLTHELGDKSQWIKEKIHVAKRSECWTEAEYTNIPRWKLTSLSWWYFIYKELGSEAWELLEEVFFICDSMWLTWRDHTVTSVPEESDYQGRH